MMQPFTSCKLDCTSNGDIHFKRLVKEVPFLMWYSCRMVRDTLVSESLVLEGRRLFAAH